MSIANTRGRTRIVIKAERKVEDLFAVKAFTERSANGAPCELGK